MTALRKLPKALIGLATALILLITPHMAWADETDDSLAGLTDEQLAQLDEQLGIMPLGECSSQPGLGKSDKVAWLSFDFIVDGRDTSIWNSVSVTQRDNAISAGSSCTGRIAAVAQMTNSTDSAIPTASNLAFSANFTTNQELIFDGFPSVGGSDTMTNKYFDQNTFRSGVTYPKGTKFVVAGSYKGSTNGRADGAKNNLQVTVTLPNGTSYTAHTGPEKPNRGISMEFSTPEDPDPEPGEPDPVYYTLSYNKNASDATGSMSSQTVEEGTRVTISSNRFTRPGYTFIGWATSPNGSVAYQPGNRLTLNSNRTLYAKWQKDVAYVDLNYDANGGNGSHSPTSVEENTQATIPGNLNDSFNRPGYELTGWNTDPNGNGTSYQPGATVPMGTTDKTLYAQWDPITVQITYDPNGGNGSHEPTEGEANTTITIPADVNDPFHRDHYTLTGWNTKPDGSGDSYAPGAGVHMGVTDQTLYAQWKRIPVKVNYDPNGGEGSHEPTPGDAGGTVTIPDDLNDPFTKPGSILIGWNTKPDGSGDSYEPGDMIPMGDEDETLYAQWKELPSVMPSTGGDGAPVLPAIIAGTGLIAALAVWRVSRRMRGGVR